MLRTPYADDFAENISAHKTKKRHEKGYQLFMHAEYNHPTGRKMQVSLKLYGLVFS
jgi:hypothetical protein